MRCPNSVSQVPKKPLPPSHERPSGPIALLIFGLLLALAAGPLAAGEIPFVEVLEVTQTFDRGRSVIAADIDGDGDLDLAGAAPSMSNEVAWWENDLGDGTTWTKDSIDAALPNAVCVRAGDLDGDGDLDLAAASLGDGTPNSSKVIIYINTNGDGSSWNPIVVDDVNLTGAVAVAIGDVDLDGDMDLLGGAMNDEDFFWYENTIGNASTWTERNISSLFNGTRSITLIDFDHDGDLDALAAGEFEDEVAWFENPGPDMVDAAAFWNRNVINPAAFDGASGACPADFDHDGDYDVAAVNDAPSTNPDTVVWWENAGDNVTFTLTTLEPSFSGAHGVHCADMDADGDIDIFAAARTEEPSPFGAATWWENRLNETDPSWVEHDVDDGFAQARATWTGDINSDGDLDALVIGDNDKIIYYENRSIHRNAAFSTATAETLDADHQGASGVAYGDIDGDGDGDVAATADTEGRVDWYSNNGDGTWTQVAIASSLVGIRAVAVGDIDHDGDLDVAVAVDGTIDDVLWFANTAGDGSTWSAANTIDATVNGASDVAIGDVDGDGTHDVVVAAFDDEEFVLFANTMGDGTVWTETSISAAASATHNGAIAVCLDDLDRDGDLDVLGGAETDDDAVFLSNSSGDGSTWIQTVIDGNTDGINRVIAVDIDGDGDLDAAGANEVADTIVWWQNTNGIGTTWSAANSVDAFHNGARALAASDFDADGDMDLVATQSKDGGKISWYANDDGVGGSFTEHVLTATFDGATALAVADVDWNGQPDVIAAAETANDVTFFPNNGGQFGLDTTNTSPLVLGNSVTDDLLEIVARHNGIAGEPAVELTSFELLFEELEGDPLTTGEVQQIIENLFVYLDDGVGADPGNWDGADTLVTTVANGSLSLDAAGIQSVAFVKDDPNVAIALGTTKTYFVVAETTSGYDSAGLVFFQVSHVTEASSTADDITFDTPLRLEAQPNTTSNAFEVNTTDPIEADLELLSITDSPDPVDAGSQVTYTVTVRNNGPWPASNARVTSTLPTGTSLVSTAGCNEDPSGSPTCTLGSISAGAEKAFTITVSVPVEATDTLTYTAAVTSDTTDPTMGNESDSEDTMLQQPSVITVAKGTAWNGYLPNGTVQYFIVIENTGAGDEASVMVTDTFPADITGVTWNCKAEGGASCGSATGSGNLAETVGLPGGGRITFAATGTLSGAASGTISNTATATGTLSNDTAVYGFDVLSGASEAPFAADGFESGSCSGWSSNNGGC